MIWMPAFEKSNVMDIVYMHKLCPGAVITSPHMGIIVQANPISSLTVEIAGTQLFLQARASDPFSPNDTETELDSQAWKSGQSLGLGCNEAWTLCHT